MTRSGKCPLAIHRDQGERVAVGDRDAGIDVQRGEECSECDLHFCFRRLP